eukprot:CAMPEP_0194251074 /NCGR_PEP_ID=MMETSP0158-20130606/24505_1 /TAXON_ID=33649 /ORGANISM="Thalassionema nitzschioides, Strain L26-B" /LENGTH=666 /DNA_ID=CAMNT_0038988087 /DNA_START=6 /DNA_END=2006 /DNA_ORIENTATION=+
MSLSRLFPSPLWGKDTQEMKKMTKSGPPAYMFGSPSPGLPAYTFGSPSPMKQGFQHNFQQEMHDIRLDNYQDDLMPLEEEIKLYQLRPSKLSFTQKRWFRLLIIALLCITILVSLSCIIVYYSQRKKATDTTDARWDLPKGFVSIDSRLQETIKLLLNDVDHKALTNTKSPQFQATRWIADIDALQVPLELTSSFKQRYALALLWFATSGKNWKNWDNFLTKSHECDWRVPVKTLDGEFEMGVQCNFKKEVTSIILQNSNLSGSLPLEIQMLSTLERLSLDHNNITDFKSIRNLTKLTHLTIGYNHIDNEFPEWIAELSKLQILGLSHNGFTSTLPSQLKELTDLSSFAVDNNKMSGPLEILEDMPWLSTLYLEDNSFTGTITNNFLHHLEIIEVLDVGNNKLRGNVGRALLRRPRLQILDVHGNRLNGPLPDFPHSSSLRYLALQNNFFEGSIPSAISGLTALRHLDISNNRLSGDIPTRDLNRLTKLEYLSLASNRLFTPGPLPDLSMLSNLRELSMKESARTGDIPSWITDVGQLALLDLSANRLESTIPSVIGQLTNLKFLLLSRNMLSGKLPSEIASMKELDLLLLDQNELTGDADGLFDVNKPIIVADCDELKCDSCAGCCFDHDPEKCFDRGWLAFFNTTDHHSIDIFQQKNEQQWLFP